MTKLIRVSSSVPSSIVEDAVKSFEGDIATLENQGYRVVDYIESHSYKLVLLGAMGMHQIVVVRGESSFLLPIDQVFRPADRGVFKDILKVRNTFVKQIRSWIGEHGEIMVGSMNEAKARTYHSLLKGLFDVSDITEIRAPFKSWIFSIQ